jgi:hypothetical protein
MKHAADQPLRADYRGGKLGSRMLCNTRAQYTCHSAGASVMMTGKSIRSLEYD